MRKKVREIFFREATKDLKKLRKGPFMSGKVR